MCSQIVYAMFSCVYVRETKWITVIEIFLRIMIKCLPLKQTVQCDLRSESIRSRKTADFLAASYFFVKCRCH